MVAPSAVAVSPVGGRGGPVVTVEAFVTVTVNECTSVPVVPWSALVSSALVGSV